MAVTINTMLEHTIHDKCLRCRHSVIEFYMTIRIDDSICSIPIDYRESTTRIKGTRY